MLVMDLTFATLEVHEPLVPEGHSSEEPRADYEFCPRCALVVNSGQVNAHLTTCSGVT